jgi:hypothetical protein
MSENKHVEIRFNKLRKKLPHRYTGVVAKNHGSATPTQVKLVFTGRIKDPILVDGVYTAAMKVAQLYAKTTQLLPRKKKSALSSVK